MHTDNSPLQSILDSPYRYSMPAYQRFYSWGGENRAKLWSDICGRVEDDKHRAHFMGTLVFVTMPHSPGSDPILRVVDGQQRLITLSLLLCALRNVARLCSLGQLAEEIHETYVVNPFQEGQSRLRIFPRQRDREDYTAAVTGNRAPEGEIGATLRYFTKRIRKDVLEMSGRPNGEGGPAEPSDDFFDDGTAVEKRLRKLLAVLKSSLDFVHITLDSERRAYQTFQSLNSTGLDLAQSDLIRCEVMMHVPSRSQEDFDREEWKPVEDRFRDEDGDLDEQAFSRFFRHILLTEGTYVYKDDTAEAFKKRYIGSGPDFDPPRLAALLRRHARLYDYLREKREHPSAPVAQAIQRLIALETTTAFPLALKLLAMLDAGEVSDQVVAEALRRVAGFVFRRKVCGQASTGYVRWFTFACKHVSNEEEGILPGLTAFLEKKGYPDDEQFAEAFARYELFRSDYKRAALKALERSYPHRERADLSQAQVEHVMPQVLTSEWRAALGPDANRLHERLVHTPGNLTLSAYNGELSNAPFSEKCEEYERSNIVMTRRLAGLKTWDQKTIEARSRMLAEQATEIWIGPPF